MKYQMKGIDLIVQNTPLSKGEAMYQLNKQEDKIRVRETYKDANNYNKNYFKLASAYVIGKYK